MTDLTPRERAEQIAWTLLPGLMEWHGDSTSMIPDLLLGGAESIK